jgi:predicted nucleic acid-binding protein
LIFVDSSVLIDFLRGRSTTATGHLRQLELESSPVAIPGICCQEVLQGAKDEREWRLLRETFEARQIVFPRDPWEAHQKAARIFFDCRRRGLTIRSTIDCLVAQLVLENNGQLLHDDEDFERIRQVRPLQTLR